MYQTKQQSLKEGNFQQGDYLNHYSTDWPKKLFLKFPRDTLLDIHHTFYIRSTFPWQYYYTCPRFHQVQGPHPCTIFSDHVIYVLEDHAELRGKRTESFRGVASRNYNSFRGGRRGVCDRKQEVLGAIGGWGWGCLRYSQGCGMEQVFGSCQQAPGSAQIKNMGLSFCGPTTCRRRCRIWVSKGGTRKQKPWRTDPLLTKAGSWNMECNFSGGEGAWAAAWGWSTN